MNEFAYNLKCAIPNSITCCNLLSGCISCVMSMQQNYYLALLWIISGAVFDFFDGFAARLLGVSSSIGKELDSLADDITFGAAPGFMLFNVMREMSYPSYLEPYSYYIPFTAFIISAFSAVRLAKFNIDKRQTCSFIGMPTPSNALFWGSLILGWKGLFVNEEPCLWRFLLAFFLVGLTSWLLICEIPMFSFKFKKFKLEDNQIRFSFAGYSIMLLFALGLKGFAPIIASYVVVSVCLSLYKKKSN